MLLSSVAGHVPADDDRRAGGGPAVARSYDVRGRRTGVAGGRGAITVDVPAGGFMVAG